MPISTSSPPAPTTTDAKACSSFDELGRLEFIRNQGLTSALALLDEGPNPAFPHALIVVRDVLVDLARERFAPAWGDPALVSPTQDAEEAIRRAFEATR